MNTGKTNNSWQKQLAEECRHVSHRTELSWYKNCCLLHTCPQGLSVNWRMWRRMMIRVAIHGWSAACHQAQWWHLWRVTRWQVGHWTPLHHLGICSIAAPTPLPAIPFNGNLQFCWRAQLPLLALVRVQVLHVSVNRWQALHITRHTHDANQL